MELRVTFRSSQYVRYTASNMMNRKEFRRKRRGLVQVLSCHLPGWTEEKQGKTISGLPVEIRTEHLPNAILQHYRYISLFVTYSGIQANGDTDVSRLGHHVGKCAGTLTAVARSLCSRVINTDGLLQGMWMASCEVPIYEATQRTIISCSIVSNPERQAGKKYFIFTV
jgi:hypothetical protein